MGYSPWDREESDSIKHMSGLSSLPLSHQGSCQGCIHLTDTHGCPVLRLAQRAVFAVEKM